jgi:hypothetical protein
VQRQGWKTLQQDGFEKVRRGVSTIEEVFGSYIRE